GTWGRETGVLTHGQLVTPNDEARVLADLSWLRHEDLEDRTGAQRTLEARKREQDGSRRTVVLALARNRREPALGLRLAAGSAACDRDACPKRRLHGEQPEPCPPRGHRSSDPHDRERL